MTLQIRYRYQNNNLIVKVKKFFSILKRWC